MIRDGRRQAIDYGPTPGRALHATYNGGLVVAPARKPKPEPVYRERTFDANAWRRMKRATDPAWAAHVRDRDRARKQAESARRKAA